MASRQLYAVRMIENREAVGLFWCARRDLWWAVDEVTDPGVCEFVAVRGDASVQFPARGADVFDPETSEDFVTSPVFSEALYDAFGRKWRKLPYATEAGGGVHAMVEAVKRRRAAH